jgi:hypothetical protein
MQQIKTLVIAVYCPDDPPSMKIWSVRTAEEFYDFLFRWGIEQEAIAKSWEGFSSQDADVLAELLKDRAEGYWEGEDSTANDLGWMYWQLYHDCEFIARLI